MLQCSDGFKKSFQQLLLKMCRCTGAFGCFCNAATEWFTLHHVHTQIARNCFKKNDRMRSLFCSCSHGIRIKTWTHTARSVDAYLPLYTTAAAVSPVILVEAIPGRSCDCLQVLSELKTMGFTRITFVGGEPLLHPHIDHLIMHAKALGLNTCLVTNGSLLTKDRLMKIGGQ